MPKLIYHTGACSLAPHVVLEWIGAPYEEQAVEFGDRDLLASTEFVDLAPVWSADGGRAKRVARRLRHGTVWINDFGPYLPQAEWGGFGASGIGRELGPTGLGEYLEAKHVYENLRPSVTGWFAERKDA